ncbi:MAG TPA: LytTR family DNA-binding domain-containing protein [Chryseosolibacter sp.]|nr:LytTR family DNA-binding domain-containing protein [Chryseosolibacter sp.]
MRIVLVDDDFVIRDNLKTMLSIYAPDTHVVGEADGVKAGIACIKENRPDVVLLDVEMKDGTGFDLLSFYGPLDFKVIFVTGYDAYAVKAFKFSAVDYILKPVDPVELSAALQKAKLARDQNEQQIGIANLVQNNRTDRLGKKIVLKDSETVYLVAIRDIIRCESETNYTRFYLLDGRVLMISRTLKEFDLLFEDHGFYRAHQSHLINLHHFDRYEKKDGGSVFMKDGSALPVAIRKKEALMSELERLK